MRLLALSLAALLAPRALASAALRGALLAPSPDNPLGLLPRQDTVECPPAQTACADGTGCCPSGVACSVSAGQPVCAQACAGSRCPNDLGCCQPGYRCPTARGQVCTSTGFALTTQPAVGLTTQAGAAGGGSTSTAVLAATTVAQGLDGTSLGEVPSSFVSTQTLEDTGVTMTTTSATSDTMEGGAVGGLTSDAAEASDSASAAASSASSAAAGGDSTAGQVGASASAAATPTGAAAALWGERGAWDVMGLVTAGMLGLAAFLM